MNDKKIETSDDVYRVLNNSNDNLLVLVIRGHDTLVLTIKPGII